MLVRSESTTQTERQAMPKRMKLFERKFIFRTTSVMKGDGPVDRAIPPDAVARIEK